MVNDPKRMNVFLDKRYKFLLLVLLWVIHVSIYLFFSAHEGTLMLTLLPVSITGLFYGSRWGLIAGIFSFFLNLSLIVSLSDPLFIFNYAFIMGSIITVSLGFIIGKLNDYYKRIKVELQERKMIEKKLQRSNKKMEEMHRIATRFTNIFSEQELFELGIEGMENILGYNNCAFYRSKGERVELITSSEDFSEFKVNIDDIYHETISEGDKIIESSNNDKRIISVPVDKEAVFISSIEKEISEYDSELTWLLITHIEENLLRVRSEDREKFLLTLLRHDLNNKINIIMGYLELLNEDNLTDEEKNYLEKTLETGFNAQDLIRKVGKLKDIQSEDSKSSVNVDMMIERAVETNKTILDEKRIEVEHERNEYNVFAGPLLEEVFHNIIENAINHSGCKNVKISSCKRDDYISVCIEDDGKGIPDNIKEQLFQKGIKEKSSSGMGIGTYLIQKIIDHYDGSILVDDSDMGGAKFKIHLKGDN